MSLRKFAIVSLLSGFAACAPQEPLRGPVEFAAPADAAALRQSLSDVGFALAESANGLPATLTIEPDDPRGLCQTVYIRDRFGERASRGRFVAADQVVILATETASGQIKLEARGRYLNRFDNLRTTKACDVSASFETVLRQALGSN